MALIFDVKVIPRSAQQKWLLDKNGQLKCYIKSAPEKGKANKELIKLLAKALKISQGDITIITGATSRIKKIKINAQLSLDALLTALGIERHEQLHLF